MAGRSGREAGTEQGWAVVEAAAESAGGLLGDSLASAYAIGSLGHGGFAAATSDVDLEGARFPAIDRLDLMRSGVLLSGADLRERFGVEPPPDEVLGNAINFALVRRPDIPRAKEITQRAAAFTAATA